MLPTLLAAAGCSVRRLAIDGLAEALAGSAEAFASETDPELVRDALPFALKAVEALLLEEPEQADLLLAACSGFTQYTYAFVEKEAKALAETDYERSSAQRARAVRLYMRARDYGLRGLELEHPGIGERLRREPSAAAAELEQGDMPFVYWTAAAWGLAIAGGQDRPELAADLDAVRMLFRRALELDESFMDGALHEALITIEALPEAMGGSRERAREHFERAVELSHGKRATPYVSFVESILVPAQDRAGFEDLLSRALAIDPDEDPSARLANHLAQERARHLLATVDDLFFEAP